MVEPLEWHPPLSHFLWPGYIVAQALFNFLREQASIVTTVEGFSHVLLSQQLHLHFRVGWRE